MVKTIDYKNTYKGIIMPNVRHKNVLNIFSFDAFFGVKPSW